MIKLLYFVLPDDPSFWVQLMTQELQEAKKEEESTNSFAHSLGLVPSKTHEKYCSDVAPHHLLDCKRPSGGTCTLGSSKQQPFSAQTINTNNNGKSSNISSLADYSTPVVKLPNLSSKDISSKYKAPESKTVSETVSTNESSKKIGLCKDSTVDAKEKEVEVEDSSDGDSHDFSLTLSNFFEENLETICKNIPGLSQSSRSSDSFKSKKNTSNDNSSEKKVSNNNSDSKNIATRKSLINRKNPIVWTSPRNRGDPKFRKRFNTFTGIKVSPTLLSKRRKVN